MTEFPLTLAWPLPAAAYLVEQKNCVMRLELSLPLPKSLSDQQQQVFHDEQ
jgi:hypothetical protein